MQIGSINTDDDLLVFILGAAGIAIVVMALCLMIMLFIIPWCCKKKEVKKGSSGVVVSSDTLPMVKSDESSINDNEHPIKLTANALSLSQKGEPAPPPHEPDSLSSLSYSVSALSSALEYDEYYGGEQDIECNMMGVTTGDGETNYNKKSAACLGFQDYNSPPPPSNKREQVVDKGAESESWMLRSIKRQSSRNTTTKQDDDDEQQQPDPNLWTQSAPAEGLLSPIVGVQQPYHDDDENGENVDPKAAKRALIRDHNKRQSAKNNRNNKSDDQTPGEATGVVQALFSPASSVMIDVQSTDTTPPQATSSSLAPDGTTLKTYQTKRANLRVKEDELRKKLAAAKLRCSSSWDESGEKV